MRYEQSEDRLIVRLESGERIMGELQELLRSEHVEFTNVTGAGAVDWLKLGYWNADTQRYEFREFEEQLEVVSFQGNGARKDGDPFLHLHGVFGRRDFSVIGGHIADARIHPTLELWLRTEPITVRRARDAATGLDLLDLPERRP
ncbi:MAG TPA: DUF296 domain-containing protein [Chloroflexota bacterium]|jgi:predicted DNA-binding protein with PD1-like motif|nr:DUF296 domain-containing protein [Chloroflexota bacterium]